jgi:L-cysteine desulfidase
MGCTEPIALAYCAAKAREVLGALPDRCEVEASGNIIKNVKSVIVPNTGGLKGIAAAVAAGVVAGNAGKILEVISDVTPEQKVQIKDYLEKTDIRVKPLESDEVLDMIVTLYKGESYTKVRIANYHTNIVLIEKDGQVLYEIGVKAESGSDMADRSLLNAKDIYEFATTSDLQRG